MKNKDNMTPLQIFNQDFKVAMEEKNFEKVGEAMQTYGRSLVAELADAAAEYRQTADASILASRGVRSLTSAEQSFYDGIITAMQAPDVRQALTGADKTIPQTVIDTVLADIENKHPLLAALDIVNTYGSTKWILAKDKMQRAQWGAITSAITAELTGEIDKLEFSDNKLTAFLPVPKDLLKLGASYLDAYVRRILTDALACGLEYGAVKGTGNNMPIGMVKDLDGAVTNNNYADKTAVAVTSFDVTSYMALVARLAEKPKATGEASGRPRAVTKVALIVNPADYLTKIIPATTVLATDGSYKRDIFPFPTEVFQTEQLSTGEAVLGVMENGKIKYQMFVSTGTSGNIEYSDEYRFLEDARVYAIKLLGTGRPVDNNCFVKLNIANLEALKLKVEVSNIADAAGH